ncbi:MAG: homocysteine S-methyltransferase family protein [candidate division WOR-3 bacterium]|nr:MAG: homocysteine S-methyltransferase family protein [candidate division WOR-3 bacterium]
MSITDILAHHDLILKEGAIIEVLRRSHNVTLHPRLENVLLVYDAAGKQALSQIYNEYITVAHKAGIPIMICAPTWRANKERLAEADESRNVNKDAVAFMKHVRSTWREWQDNILIGAITGCKNDAYKPDEGLTTQEAYDFHSWQIDKLVEAGVDYLIAETLPSAQEAAGIARAMSKTRIPYFIGFVINTEGTIFDGSTLEHAFNVIDTLCDPAPVGFVICCSYPSFLNAGKQPDSVLSRLVGYLANASSKSQTDLDGSTSLQIDDVADWGKRMIALNKNYGVKILGGCCGTDARHLQYIVDNISI